MFSPPDEDALHVSKKRKSQRACDCCRQRKIRCDGPQMRNNRCSNCISRRIECTYVEVQHKQKGSYPSSYVEHLESRLKRMETLVEKLCPDSNVRSELEVHRSSAPEQPVASNSRHIEAIDNISPLPLALTPHNLFGSDDFDTDTVDHQDVDDGLTEGIESLSLDGKLSRYHGKSSGMAFMRNALELKDQMTGNTPKQLVRERHQHPWLRCTVEAKIPIYDHFYFPPADLMDALVDLYFLNINNHLPLLHEPTFKKCIRDGLHLRYEGFGATVLLVCANGARFARDPRVLLESNQPQSAGWKWFQPVEDTRKPPISPAQLYDLQIYVLMMIFLQGTSAPQSSWTLIGVGIRAAVDVGAHRRNMYGTNPTPEGELWRRAFWILVLLDWTGSHGLGRPPSIHDEDMDLTLPTEVDDEHWTTADGDNLFKQPRGKPSKITSFNHLIRLGQILAFASRTLYSINKSRAQLERGDHQWEQRIVAELDSSLNKWVDSLPTHLRWDPGQPDPFFLRQSATLYAHYYQFQIAVHRPFISAARRSSPLSLPSLIICTNAARSCIQVLDTLYQRQGSPTCWNTGPLCMSGIMLVLSVLGERRSGRTASADRDLTYVQKCIVMLKSTKYEWHTSEALCEIFDELTTTAHAPAAATVPSAQTAAAPITSEPGASLPTPSRNTAQERSGSMSRDKADTESSFTSTTFAEPVTDQKNAIQPEAPQPAPLFHTDEFTRLLFGASYDIIDQQSPNQGAPSTSSYPFSFQASVPSQSHPQLVAGNEYRSTLQANSFDMDVDGGSMFGLEPLGYSEAVSLLPSVNVPPASGIHREDSNVNIRGTGDVDFAFLADALNM